MIVMLSRKDRLGQALVAAGDSGLTGRQMKDVVGGNWSRWLDELKADGWLFAEHPSRFGRDGEIFRWVLRYEPLAAEPDDDTPAEPEQLALLEPSVGARPASALEAA